MRDDLPHASSCGINTTSSRAARQAPSRTSTAVVPLSGLAWISPPRLGSDTDDQRQAHEERLRAGGCPSPSGRQKGGDTGTSWTIFRSDSLLLQVTYVTNVIKLFGMTPEEKDERMMMKREKNKKKMNRKKKKEAKKKPEEKKEEKEEKDKDEPEEEKEEKEPRKKKKRKKRRKRINQFYKAVEVNRRLASVLQPLPPNVERFYLALREVVQEAFGRAADLQLILAFMLRVMSVDVVYQCRDKYDTSPSPFASIRKPCLRFPCLLAPHSS